MLTRASGQRSTRRQSNCGCDCVGRNAKNALDAEVTEAAPALYWMWQITIKGVAVIAKFNNESCVSLCVVWKLYLKPIFVVVVGQNSHCLHWNCCLCPEACFAFFYEKCISMFPMSGLAARSFDSLQSFADRFFWFCSQTAQWGFFEAMPTPDAVWKSRWHQRGFFFFFRFPACWPWICSALCVTFWDCKADRNRGMCTVWLLLVSRIQPTPDCMQWEKSIMLPALGVHMYLSMHIREVVLQIPLLN